MQPVDWFGGFVGGQAGGTLRVPLPARQLHPEPMLWTVGDLPARAASHSDRCAAVFGHCSMSDLELAGLTEGADDPLADSNPLGWMNPVGWNGCYTIVRCDPATTRILTDPAGAQPVYITSIDGGLAWGSSARALAGLAGRGVDEEFLRTALAGVPGCSGPSEPRGKPVSARPVSTRPVSTRPASTRLASARSGTALRPSAFAGVATLPPGCWVRLRNDGGIDVETAWEPADRSVGASVERLRAALAGGVEARTSELARVTADCSGGVDSTTVCLLCDPTRVTAISVRPQDVVSGGDLDYARAVDAAYPMMRRRQIVLGDEHLPYTGLDRLPPTDEPPRSVTVAARTAHICDVLRDVGSDLHLTGDGADALLNPPLSYLSRLSRRRPRAAWRHARGWAYLTGQSPWLLRDDGPRLERVRAAARPAASDQQLVAALGARFGNPYFDNRVVDAVLAARPERYASPREYKPLLVTAFADLLPPAVAGRRTKATMVADHHRGIRANLPELLGMLDGELAARGLIDPAVLADSLRDAAAGMEADLPVLEAAIGTEAWLRTVDAAGPIAWEPAREGESA